MAVTGGRFKYNRGDAVIGPRYTKYTPVGGASDLNDEVMGWAPRTRCEFLEDFTGPQRTFTVTLPLFEEDGQTNHIDTEASDIARASFMVPRAGVLIGVQLIAEDALAANDTNYVAFTLTNNQNSGAGTTEMLLVTGDANTTKATGGTAIAAELGRAFSLTATTADRRVAAGDLLTFLATSNGTLANEVHTPAVRLTFATVPDTLTPRTTKTVGTLAVAPVDDTACGEALLQLGATSEANVAGLDWGDQLSIPANARPLFQCRIKFSGVAENTRFVVGLADAYAATFDDIVNNCWFRLEGNALDLLAEVDDSTTDDDDNDTGFDVVAATYYLLTIDMTDKGAIRFSVDDTCYLELAGAAFAAADVLQPVVYVQKSTGTGTESCTIDYIRVTWDRSP